MRTPASGGGGPARRECEHARQGTVDLLAAFAVRTGQVHGIVRPRQRPCESIELLELLDRLTPRRQVIHLILGPVKPRYSAEVARFISYRPGRCAFHWLPPRGSWLSCIAAWFAILGKECLQRAAFAAAPGVHRDLQRALRQAFTWRKGVKVYQRLKDKLAARTRAAPPAASPPEAA